MPPFRSALRTLVPALTLVVLAAACGPTANALPTALPAVEGSAPVGAAASGAAGSPIASGAITDPAQAWPAFAACLRSHGLQIADPELDANGNPTWTTPDDLKKLITEPIRADCGPIIAALTESGPTKNESRPSFSFDSLVAHATCMREHGLTEWPDPNPDELDGGMPPGYDKTDPTVLAALIACESRLIETTASPSPAL
jgi:hypothetical protein